MKELMYEKDFRAYLRRLADQFGSQTALSMARGSQWIEVDFHDLEQLAILHSEKFTSLGFPPGTHIGLLAEPSIEWLLVAFAAWLGGYVLIPLDPKLGAMELASVVEHSDAEVLVVDEKFSNEAQLCFRFAKGLVEQIPLTQFSARKVTEADRRRAQKISAKLPRVSPQSVALICYTSGTVSKPKGVMVAHRTILFQPVALQTYDMIRDGDVVFNMLPLNHLFALNAGVVSCLWAGAEVVIASTLNIGEMLEQVRARKSTQMMTVPLFLELFKTGIEAKISEKDARTQKSFRRALRLSNVTKLSRLRKRIFSKVTSALGKDFKYFVCGGAPIQKSTERFFKLLGLPAYPGYGLTETGPVISVNSVAHHRSGSVGKPSPGIEVKIHYDGENRKSKSSKSDLRTDGEIWTRGPHTFLGYYKDKEQTEEILSSDGWLRTGDLGVLDKRNYLYITGRKKSMIVLQSGKKVHAEEIESRISGSDIIKEVVALGHSVSGQGEKLALLLTPHERLLEDSALTHRKIEEMIATEVERRLEGIAPYKKPSLLRVYYGQLPKTNLQKIKRGEAQKILRTLI